MGLRRAACTCMPGPFGSFTVEHLATRFLPLGNPTGDLPPCDPGLSRSASRTFRQTIVPWFSWGTCFCSARPKFVLWFSTTEAITPSRTLNIACSGKRPLLNSSLVTLVLRLWTLTIWSPIGEANAVPHFTCTVSRARSTVPGRPIATSC